MCDNSLSFRPFCDIINRIHRAKEHAYELHLGITENDGVSYEELKEDVAFAEAQSVIRAKCDEFQSQFESLDKSCPDKMTGVNSSVGDCFVVFAQWVKLTEEPPTGKYVISDSRSMMQYTFTSALNMARTVIRNQEAMLKF